MEKFPYKAKRSGQIVQLTHEEAIAANQNNLGTFDLVSDTAAKAPKAPKKVTQGKKADLEGIAESVPPIV